MSDDDKLIRCQWTGEALEPQGNWSRNWLIETLDTDEIVMVEVNRIRSGKSHRHQFAEIKDLWETLPESMQDLPYARSPTALRKHALMATGYYDAETIDAGTEAAAERVAAMAKRWTDTTHGYSIVQVRGPIVTIYTPQSQSYKAMGAELFKESKSRVLDWINQKIQEPRGHTGE